MQRVDNDHVVAFDVDDTLIMWPWSHEDTEEEKKKLLLVNHNGYKTLVLPNEKHIELLKRYKAKGKVIIVWSQSGNEWAELIVKTLGLEEYVDFVFTKPEKYVDDLRADEWMEYVYLGIPNSHTPNN